MSAYRRSGSSGRSCRAQRGQAYAEYVVMLTVVILLLIVGGDDSVINQLLGAFRDFYQSYSYALSVP